MKRAISCFIVLLLLIVPCFAEPVTRLEYSYNAYDDHAEITGYKGTEINIILPETLSISDADAVPVTHVGESAFYGNTYAVTVTVGESFTVIGKEAFSHCPNLVSVKLPNGLTELSAGAFSYCSLLTDITLPDTITHIDDFAFEGCARLTTLVIPASVEYIGYDAFMTCENLILDCSQNEYAAEYARQNNINTLDSKPFDVLITCAVVTGAALIIVFAIIAAANKLSKRK